MEADKKARANATEVKGNKEEVMDEEETLSCCSCAAEPCDDDFLNEGWSEGEFGLVCPECAVFASESVGASVGVEALANVVAAERLPEERKGE